MDVKAHEEFNAVIDDIKNSAPEWDEDKSEQDPSKVQAYEDAMKELKNFCPNQ